MGKAIKWTKKLLDETAELYRNYIELVLDTTGRLLGLILASSFMLGVPVLLILMIVELVKWIRYLIS